MSDYRPPEEEPRTDQPSQGENPAPQGEPPRMAQPPQQPQQPAPPPQQPPQPPRYVAPPPGMQGQPPRPQGPPPPQRPPQYGPPQPYQGPPLQGPPPGYGPPPPGYRPPYAPMGSFPQPPKRNRVLPVVIGVAVLLFVVGMAAVGLLAGTSGGGSTTSGGGLGIWGPKIGVLNIEGVIVSDDTPGVASTKVLVEQVKAWAKNDSIKAIVLRVNSPGGGVSATQDLYHALNEFREKTNKPVITSMGDIAASGGYYTAMASDEVYANEGTLTGSIGVILSFYDLQNLQDKVGIHPRNVKSGQFKDIGSASRSMTLEEQELLNEMIGDVFDQFFEVVMANRAPQVRSKIALANNLRVEDVTDDQVRDYLMQYCDGRIFSGRQATETGMIDGTMTLEQVLDHTRQKLGLDPQTGVVVAPVRPKGLFGSISGIANKLNNLPIDGHPGAKFEYRFAP